MGTQDDALPLRIFFDAATMTPELAVVVVESLSRMVGMRLQIVSTTPDPGDPERVCVQLREAA